MEEILLVHGERVLFYFNQRRYPGVVFKWGYWKFDGEPNSAYRSLGDPYSGTGALDRMRRDVKKKAKEAILKGEHKQSRPPFI